MCAFLNAAFMILCAFFAQSQNPIPSRGETHRPRQAFSGNTKQQSVSPDQRGTVNSPLFVRVIPTPKTEKETTQEIEDREEKRANDRKLVDFTRGLVIATVILGLVGLLQLGVFGYQAIQLRNTVRAAGEQSEAMERAIGEAARSASAMEEVAHHIEASIQTAANQSKSMEQSVKEASRLASAMEVVSKEIAISAKAATDSVTALKERAAKQMRAYLSVVIGSGVYQERDKQLRFEAKPNLVNAGHTPAHNVKYKAKAEILPVPLPDDFSFPLSVDFLGGALLGPQQTAFMSAIVDNYCDDAEINDIKVGKGKALFVWGVVYYEDVFGDSHYTKFCQSTLWQADGKVFGYYIPKNNEAT
jgi:hypothetical protein